MRSLAALGLALLLGTTGCNRPDPAQEAAERREAESQFLALCRAGNFRTREEVEALAEILVKSLRRGDLASEHEALLAFFPRHRVDADLHSYTWWIPVPPHPDHPDGTYFGLEVDAAGSPLVIEYVGGGYSSD
jgi:hypothetical protein